MLALLVSPDHGERLRELLARFRREEVELVGLLHDVQQDVEQAHQVLVRERLDGAPCAGTGGVSRPDGDTSAGPMGRAWRAGESWPGHHATVTSLRLLCAELEAQYEVVATELLHVRLAVAGAEEELARFDFLRHGLATACSTPA